jgi:hypothetical protein
MPPPRELKTGKPVPATGQSELSGDFAENETDSQFSTSVAGAIPNYTASQDEIFQSYLALNRRFCLQRNLPAEWAERAAIRQTRELLGPAFEASVSLPDTPPVPYGQDPDEPQGPIEFLDKHWGKHFDEGVLDPGKLRNLDPKLWDALKWWAQKRGVGLAYSFSPQYRPLAESMLKRPSKASRPAPKKLVRVKRSSANSQARHREHAVAAIRMY